jgi:UDP-N-acetylmuramate: L-alanyl-gamma-D-glutamyl-meso-diaminopimelate ligase
VRSAFPAQRIWAIFEPRSATSCRRIFQSDFARALSSADYVVLPAVFRSTLPDEERLSAEQLVEDLKAGGVDARYIPRVDDIVPAVAEDARSGDVIVVMSNGGFENIHARLLEALDEAPQQ